MTDDEKRLVREAADRMFQATRQSHDDVAWEHALRPMLDEMARLRGRMSRVKAAVGALDAALFPGGAPAASWREVRQRFADIDRAFADGDHEKTGTLPGA